MTDDKIPIACTLSAGDYKARLGWIADLNARALVSHRTGASLCACGIALTP